MPRPLLAVLLGLAAAAHWLAFFAAGQFDLTSADWPRQVVYNEILRAAVSEGRLPLATAERMFDMGVRYVANLEAPLAPHSWLLVFAGDHAAIVATAVLWACLGVYGCFRLARRLQLTAPAFVLMTLFVSFNGSMVAHVSAGHVGWLTGCALPFVVEALLVMAAAGPAARRATTALALILFALLLTGAVQLVVMIAILIALCAILVPAGRLAYAVCLLQFALLSMVRTLPAAIGHWRGGRAWIADGYAPGGALDALLWLGDPAGMQTVGTTLAFGGRSAVTLPAVEFDAYVGVIGVVLLLAFGVRVARSGATRDAYGAAAHALIAPCLGLALLSIDRLYAAVVVAPVSLLTVLRVPSRFLGVAVIVALMLAVVRLDADWRARGRRPLEGLLVWSGVAAAALQLAYHSLTYSAARGPHLPVSLSPGAPVLVDALSVAGGGLYVGALVVGAAVTGVTLAWAARRVRVG